MAFLQDLISGLTLYLDWLSAGQLGIGPGFKPQQRQKMSLLQWITII